MRKSYLFCTLLIIGGCATFVEKKHPYEGYFTYGHEVSAFRACNENTVFWLNGEQDGMRVIQKESLKAMNKKQEPYQSVYVQFIGRPDSRNPIGFEDSYDGLLYLIKLI
ncbi:hypothetical protein, partial [Vibrio anguillarum]